MPLIDERGRVFGRVNLIDGIVGVVILLLIPLGYGAYLLFRTPDPTIGSIEPSVLTQEEIANSEVATIKVTGENLRPYLRAMFGTNESLGFLIQSPTSGEIKLQALAAGTYDVVLYDGVLEVARLPSALTVAPPPPPPPPPPLSLLTIRVRFFVRPGLDRAVKSGDVDVGDVGSRPADAKDTVPGAERAVLRSVDPDRKTMRGMTGVGAYSLPDQEVVVFLATISVPVLRTPLGWYYKGVPVKIGANFTFETLSYVMQGWIVDAEFGAQ